MTDTVNEVRRKPMSIGKRIKNLLRNQLPLVFSFIILLIIFIVILWSRIFFTIESGQAGVLWKMLGEGTEIDKTYTEGFYLISPLNKFYIYDIRQQVFNDSISVLTSNGLQVSIGYSIRFQPEKEFLGLLHQQLGPKYIEIAVIPEIRATIRGIVGLYKPEDLYAAQKAIVGQIANYATLRLSERYVKVDDVLIKEITLPELISKAIESKLQQQQIAQEYEYRLVTEDLEAKRKKIESEGVKTFNTISLFSIDQYLTYRGLEVYRDISKSQNAKIIIGGGGKNGIPIMLGNQ